MQHQHRIYLNVMVWVHSCTNSSSICKRNCLDQCSGSLDLKPSSIASISHRNDASNSSLSLGAAQYPNTAGLVACTSAQGGTILFVVAWWRSEAHTTELQSLMR